MSMVTVSSECDQKNLVKFLDDSIGSWLYPGNYPFYVGITRNEGSLKWYWKYVTTETGKLNTCGVANFGENKLR